jgi:predicted DNA binding CopG/RHH family protein
MANALAELVARKKEKKDERFEMRVDPDWLARIEEQAQRFGLSAAAYIRQGATEKLERDEATDARGKKK